MATLTIRMDDDAYAAIQAAGAASGKSMEAWARELLLDAARGPVVRERYAYRALGDGKAVVKRYSNHPNGTTVTGQGWSQETAGAMERVKALVIRNEPGDREAAVALLQAHFEIVVEIGV